MADHAAFLHRAGHSILIFDFQAHGESTGSSITSGYLESMDVTAAVTLAGKEFLGEKIGIVGSSLGGAAAILAEPPLVIHAAVLEMVYPNITRAVKNRISIVLGNWARPLSPLLTMQLRPRIGVGADWFDLTLKIKRLTCPKLFIAGGQDQHTTMHDTIDLFENSGDPKELWVIQNAGHENLHSVVSEEYEKRLLSFFQLHLAQSKSNGKLTP
jgi:fermentation-respiration switch protein FrsA (DUF1100 family)